MDVGKGLTGICWDGAQKMGVDEHPRSFRDTSGDEESPGFGERGQCGLSFANPGLGPPWQEQQSHDVLALVLNPKSSGKWEMQDFRRFWMLGKRFNVKMSGSQGEALQEMMRSQVLHLARSKAQAAPPGSGLGEAFQRSVLRLENPMESSTSSRGSQERGSH